MNGRPLSDDAERGFLLYFCRKQRTDFMGVFLAILIMMTTMSVAIFILVKVYTKQYPHDKKQYPVLINLLFTQLVVLADLLLGGPFLVFRLPFDMMVALIPMLIISSSIFKEKISLNLSKRMIVLPCLLIVHCILQKLGLLQMLHKDSYCCLLCLTVIFICVTLLVSISMRIREIKHVISSGNVWHSVCITLDIVYVAFPVIYVMSIVFCSILSFTSIKLLSAIVAYLIACEIAALGLRVSSGSLFIFFRRHEQRLVESMKISQSDVSHDSDRANWIYKEIYSRIVAFFETEKPYLNSELTINDLVKVTFTNKSYISRAISQFTGRNFCQFVNYYRVLYSIQLFRENPNLKVNEMAVRSGFNSTVSYNSAFQLYMCECPRDWCRKEKYKLMRQKK